MAKIKTTPLGRRVMALFLATIMCVSLVQISAFATEGFPKQIGKNYAYDSETGKWTSAENTPSTVTTKDGYTLTKSLTQTGENKFDVTLKVQTKKKVTTTTAQNPAHVVLVLDRSGSMSGDPTKQLKDAASKFVESMLGKDASDDSQVAVVTYAKNSNTEIGLTHAEQDVTNKIKGLSDKTSGGTNIQAGIRTAQSILKSGHVQGVKDVILLMSDGVPTYSYQFTGTATAYGCWKDFLGHHDLLGASISIK